MFLPGGQRDNAEPARGKGGFHELETEKSAPSHRGHSSQRDMSLQKSRSSPRVNEGLNPVSSTGQAVL